MDHISNSIRDRRSGVPALLVAGSHTVTRAA